MGVTLARLIPRRGTLPEPVARRPNDIPVVLLHGTVSSPGNFLPIARRLNNDGRRSIGIEYGHRGTDPLEVCLLDIVTQLDKLLEPRQRIDVVGHSLGGLMALRLAHLPQFTGRIRTIVGLGGCFKGQPVTMNPLLRTAVNVLVGPSLTQLMCESELSATIPAGVRLISIVSDADTIVPRSRSLVGELRTVHGVSHAWLTTLADEVSQALADAAAAEKPIVPRPVRP
ncbi:lipase family alpha/beta hydrolase [Corynebacterium mendelii]|uniref:Alpha/beta fold hydrolase n=1 Tax=Corynebacterium mendelii TaxID=2765362 RepID=A0A939E3R7_9CORY|nr:alpha/beta fold hydrolase [Corynebacterium mendelii]MBN9645057.1 alpha/beta fold hydrolase [Corynebacterium mendelii]